MILSAKVCTDKRYKETISTLVSWQHGVNEKGIGPLETSIDRVYIALGRSTCLHTCYSAMDKKLFLRRCREVIEIFVF